MFLFKKNINVLYIAFYIYRVYICNFTHQEIIHVVLLLEIYSLLPLWTNLEDQEEYKLLVTLVSCPMAKMVVQLLPPTPHSPSQALLTHDTLKTKRNFSQFLYSAIKSSILFSIPLNCTVDVPSPPDFVVAMISPRPLHGPDLAIILFLLFHSADSKQSHPQIFKPITKTFYVYENNSAIVLLYITENKSYLSNQ